MFLERIKKLQDKLFTYDVDGLLVESRTDLFYLTGQYFSAGSLLIEKEKATLFVDGRYFERAKKINFLTVLQEPFVKISGVLGFDAIDTSYSRFEVLSKQGLVKSLESPLMPLREIKSPVELQKMANAQQIGEAGLAYVVSLLSEGITEKKVAEELEIFFRREGAEGASFNTIVAFGKNSAYPHYTPSHTRLKKGDLVLIDSGVKFEGYCSDMTRCFFFGSPTEEMKEVYHLVNRAKNAAISEARAGVTAGFLDKVAREVIDKGGFKDKFTHGLGHAIGQDVHEAPYLRNKPPYDSVVLQEGMVVTIEPGIYLPGRFGVRLEDMILIEKEGCKNLTTIDAKLGREC